MNLSVLIVVALLFFVLGVVAGLLIASLRETGEKSSPKKNIPNPNASSSTPQKAEPAGNPQTGGQVEPVQLSGEKVTVRVEETVTTTAFAPAQRMSEKEMPGEVKPVSTNPVEAFARVVGGRNAKPESKSVSMAGQIDEILQEKLPDSSLSGRSIRLVELPSHEIQVLVDQEQFQGIDAVPYEDVRAFIRQAVADWEKRSTKGS